MSDERRKVFVTAYAMTAGIQEMTGVESNLAGYLRAYNERGFVRLLGKNHWHKTREAALKAAVKLAAAKVASLQKQVEAAQQKQREFQNELRALTKGDATNE